MAADQFEAITVPNLGAFGRLKRLLSISNYANTGANPRNIEYTCPVNRMAVITAMTFQPRGGTAYARVGFEVLVGGVGYSAPVISIPPLGVYQGVVWTGALWLAPADVIQSAADTGDATSDYRVVVSGLEIDWTDFGA